MRDFEVYKPFIVQHIVSAGRFARKEKWKKAVDKVWDALSYMNSLEFDIVESKSSPRKKEQLMPARIAIEKLLIALEKLRDNRGERAFSGWIEEYQEALRKVHEKVW